MFVLRLGIMAFSKFSIFEWVSDFFCFDMFTVWGTFFEQNFVSSFISHLCNSLPEDFIKIVAHWSRSWFYYVLIKHTLDQDNLNCFFKFGYKLIFLWHWHRSNFFLSCLTAVQVSLMHSISSCSFMGVNSVSWVIGWWMDWSLKVGLDVWKYGFKNMWKRNFRFHLFQSKGKTCERYVLKGQIKKVNFVSGVVHCWGDRQKVQKAYIGISCLKPSWRSSFQLCCWRIWKDLFKAFYWGSWRGCYLGSCCLILPYLKRDL